MALQFDGRAPAPTPGVRDDYDATVAQTLQALGDPKRAPGSGCAAALALSAGIESLALHLALCRRRAAAADDEGLALMETRIAACRAAVRTGFEDDARAVAALVEARRAGKADVGSPAAAFDALLAGSRALGALLPVADEVAQLAERLIEGGWAPHAVAESHTARLLARAAAQAFTLMLEGNLEVMERDPAAPARRVEIEALRAGLAVSGAARPEMAAAVVSGGDTGARGSTDEEIDVKEPYHPIDCSLHDQLEDAVVRRRDVTLELRGADGAATRVTDRIRDILVRDGAEFAVLGGGREVRLDRIASFDVGAGEGGAL